MLCELDPFREPGEGTRSAEQSGPAADHAAQGDELARLDIPLHLCSAQGSADSDKKDQQHRELDPFRKPGEGTRLVTTGPAAGHAA